MIDLYEYIINHNVPYVVVSNQIVILFENEETWSEYDMTEQQISELCVKLVIDGYHPFTLNPSTTMYTKNE